MEISDFIFIKIEGGDVTEDLKIDLPFSYPTSSIKCDINKVNTNQEIETNCTIQTSFKNVDVIGQRILKKKNKELLIVKGAPIK